MLVATLPLPSAVLDVPLEGAQRASPVHAIKVAVRKPIGNDVAITRERDVLVLPVIVHAGPKDVLPTLHPVLLLVLRIDARGAVVDIRFRVNVPRHPEGDHIAVVAHRNGLARSAPDLVALDVRNGLPGLVCRPRANVFGLGCVQRVHRGGGPGWCRVILNGLAGRGRLLLRRVHLVALNARHVLILPQVPLRGLLRRGLTVQSYRRLGAILACTGLHERRLGLCRLGRRVGRQGMAAADAQREYESRPCRPHRRQRSQWSSPRPRRSCLLRPRRL